MKKALMLGVMAVAAISTMSTAEAKKSKAYTYTFGSTYGGEYCNGVTFSADPYATGAFSGIGTYNSICANYYSPTSLGGYEGSIKPLGAGSWYTLTNAPGAQGLPGNYILIDYLNLKTLYWYLAFQAVATTYYYAVPFEIINSGPLVAGLPPAKFNTGKPINKTNLSAVLEKVKIARKVGK